MAEYESQESFEQKQMSIVPLLPNREILHQRKLVNGISHHLELLKRLPLNRNDPTICRDSIKKKYKQALKTWTLLFNGNDKCTQKKRKLEQYIRGDVLETFGMELEKYDTLSVKELVKKQSSDILCMIKLTNAVKRLCLQHACDSRSSSVALNINQEKQEPSNISKRNNNKNSSFSSEDNRSIISTNEKGCLSHQDSLEDLDAQNENSMNITDLVEDELSSSEKAKCTRRPAFSLLLFKGEYLPRPEVPVGPRLQAEIPNLIDACVARKNYFSENASGNARWLGSLIWPIEGRCTENIPEVIGKGRLDYCSCDLPGSPTCVKQHIAEARESLVADLGPAFSTWRLDEIGQEVSIKWTLKEEECFAHLMSKYRLASTVNFWDMMGKCLPWKCRKTILSYYYNVFIPRRMSIHFQSSLDDIASDDD